MKNFWDVFSILCLLLVFGFVGAFLLNMMVGEFPELKIPGLVFFILFFGAWLLKLMEK